MGAGSDHDTSEVVEYVSYTAYGQTENDYRTSRWSNFREPYRFTGNEEDIEVGLNYHGARYYSPALKRWMSADPVTTHEAGSDINPYSYGNSNPTANVDPDGRIAFLAIVGIVVLAAAISGGTNAVVQYATTGHVDWGWKGVAGAALAGGVGALVGVGAGAFAAGTLGWGAGASSAAFGGAFGGAASGALGTGLAGGSWSDVGKAALTGGISGTVGGAVGVYAGSQSTGGWTSFGGTMVGTAAGTGSGIGFGWAAWGQDPTWQSAGIAFASAFAGTIASTAVSKGYQAATEENTAGEAAGFGPNDEAPYDGTGEVAGAAAYIESRLVNTTPEQLQSRINSAASDLGIDVPATYDPRMNALTRGFLSPDKGILVGRAALVSDWQLRTTLVHEDYHVQQLVAGRLAGVNAKYAGMVNEIEARYATLSAKNAERTGITQWGKTQILNEITDLRSQIASGLRPQARYYYGQIMKQNFGILPEHVNTSPRPSWLP